PEGHADFGLIALAAVLLARLIHAVLQLQVDHVPLYTKIAGKQEAGSGEQQKPFTFPPPPGGERTARGGISPVPCFPLPASARPTKNPRALEGPGVGIDRVCLVASDSQIIHQDVLAEDLDAVLEG